MHNTAANQIKAKQLLAKIHKGTSSRYVTKEAVEAVTELKEVVQLLHSEVIDTYENQGENNNE